MTPAVFTKDTDYILTLATREARIAAIDAIIEAKLVQAATLAGQTDPVTEFMLNDGQTIIKGIYATPEQIIKSIEVLERLRNFYANQGRRTYRMINEKNFIGGR